jgi:predicted transcriptional regulator
MNVHCSPENQAKLDRAAAEQRRKTESLVEEAAERFMKFESWFIAAVNSVRRLKILRYVSG